LNNASAFFRAAVRYMPGSRFVEDTALLYAFFSHGLPRTHGTTTPHAAPPRHAHTTHHTPIYTRTTHHYAHTTTTPHTRGTGLRTHTPHRFALHGLVTARHYALHTARFCRVDYVCWLVYGLLLILVLRLVLCPARYPPAPHLCVPFTGRCCCVTVPLPRQFGVPFVPWLFAAFGSLCHYTVRRLFLPCSYPHLPRCLFCFYVVYVPHTPHLVCCSLHYRLPTVGFCYVPATRLLRHHPRRTAVLPFVVVGCGRSLLHRTTAPPATAPVILRVSARSAVELYVLVRIP